MMCVLILILYLNHRDFYDFHKMTRTKDHAHHFSACVIVYCGIMPISWYRDSLEGRVTPLNQEIIQKIIHYFNSTKVIHVAMVHVCSMCCLNLTVEKQILYQIFHVSFLSQNKMCFMNKTNQCRVSPYNAAPSFEYHVHCVRHCNVKRLMVLYLCCLKKLYV